MCQDQSISQDLKAKRPNTKGINCLISISTVINPWRLVPVMLISSAAKQTRQPLANTPGLKPSDALVVLGCRGSGHGKDWVCRQVV